MDANNYIWAKTGNGDTHWMPLWLHLRDTFQISGWIWDNRIPEKHRNLFTSDLGMQVEDAKRVYQLLSGLHDIGKCTPDFSGREHSLFTSPTVYERMKKAGFTFDSFVLNRSGKAIRHEVSSEYFLKDIIFGEEKNKKAKTVLSVISAHHGRPKSVTAEVVESLNKLKSSDPLWFKSLSNIYHFIMEYYENSEELLAQAFRTGLSWRSQMIFSGYISMADWIASNEDLFPLWDIDKIEEQSWHVDSSRFENAVTTISFPNFFDGNKIEASLPSDEMFELRFGFSTPRPSQKDLVEAVSNPLQDPNDIFILEAPMGEGKTEAALIASEILMKRSQSTGFFFGLPTMATGEAIYGRIKPYLDSLLKSTSQTATLELLHSKASLSETRRLINASAFYNETETGIISSGWLTDRYRKVLNSFLVGTVDNFLMMQLPLKFAYWRHLGLSQKVIIIDEVHAMDTTMKHYLIEALRVSGFYGCPVILCSATLKNHERETYLAAYNEGKILGSQVA